MKAPFVEIPQPTSALHIGSSWKLPARRRACTAANEEICCNGNCNQGDACPRFRTPKPQCAPSEAENAIRWMVQMVVGLLVLLFTIWAIGGVPS